jgi:hypothetical protein
VPDEEAVGVKGMNFLFGPVGLNGFVEPEFCHPKWNSFLRAINKASFTGTVLFLTAICNQNHAPFLSGAKLFQKQEALKLKLQRAGPEWLKQHAAAIAFDHGRDEDEDEAEDTFQDFITSPVITKRMRHALL